MSNCLLRLGSSLPLLTSALVCLALTAACSTSQPASGPDAAAERAAVVGLWEYQASNSAYLDRGVFKITVQDGRLQGTLRDNRLGALPIRVEVRDRSMEMVVDDLRINGRLDDDKFTAFVRRPMWDVSSRQRAGYRNRSRQNPPTGSLFARRIESMGTAVADVPLGCTDPTHVKGVQCN